MKEVVWGIIGCGNVTEQKSGPAFNKVPNSKLYAVMRRDIQKAADYARRHNVPKFYGDAYELINDKELTAIYIATPPSSHEQYCLAAIAANKPVYVEKPMALNYDAALNIKRAADLHNVKLSVAHYRNAQPYFNAIKKCLEGGSIGRVEEVQLRFLRPVLSEIQLKEPGKEWRVNSAVSGGGLFHDLAPHQLGVLLYYFGAVEHAEGIASCTQKSYAAHDKINAQIIFKNGIKFTGEWSFNSTENTDECIIKGTNGSLQFSFFEQPNFLLSSFGKIEKKSFPVLQHVQQPMIEKVVQYFLGRAPNPCSADEGVEVMRLIEACTK
ncbi:MAG TPA: Gfo/Idh/MocA family oxidoreductase [Ferruginibacter sp.]|nr:Gfo/Idh/MocA family oxidoreductase [Ferruginibacter sp.]